MTRTVEYPSSRSLACFFKQIFSELITPAVQGTIGILQSAAKFGWALTILPSNVPNPTRMANTRSNVKRVVVTSSCAAILEPGRLGKILNEEDWNEKSVNDVNAKGRGADNLDKYLASKTLAEKGIFFPKCAIYAYRFFLK